MKQRICLFVILLFISAISANAQGTPSVLHCNLRGELEIHASRDPGSSVMGPTQCGDAAFANTATSSPQHAFGQYLSRIARSGGTFYDTATYNRFAPKGYNYERPFLFAPGYYNAGAVDSALDGMWYYGTSVVRVIIRYDQITGSCSGTDCYVGIGSSSDRLNWTYMNNFTDFLTRAGNHFIRVVVSYDWLPNTYKPVIQQMSGGDPQGPTQPEGVNSLYMTPSLLIAQQQYLVDFIREIKNRDASLLSNIFSFDLQNEPHMRIDLLPFRVTDGTTTTADGVTYDMSDPAQRHQCANANWVNWANSLAAAVKSEDPNALVGVNVDAEWAGPGVQIPPGTRSDYAWWDQAIWNYSPRATVIAWYAAYVDYLDYHLCINPVLYHTGPTYDLDNYLYRAEYYYLDLNAIPVIAGEFVVEDQYLTGTPCQTLVNHFSSLLSRGFRGGLLWTWDWIDQDGGIWNTGVGDDYSYSVANGLNTFSCPY